MYISQSGDTAYRDGEKPAQYCALLINCLPAMVAEAIKTNNLDWS